jgi:hypothetical protein
MSSFLLSYLDVEEREPKLQRDHNTLQGEIAWCHNAGVPFEIMRVTEFDDEDEIVGSINMEVFLYPENEKCESVTEVL